MSSSTNIRLFLKFIPALLILCICNALNAQQGFYKVFPAANYHNATDLFAIDHNNYVLLTSDHFYRLDDKGNIKAEKVISEGTYSQLESVTRDNDGLFWIAATVFDDINTSRKVLYKLDPSGQVLLTRSFTSANSFEDLRLISSSNNTFFFAYKDRAASGNGATRALLLDKNGNTIWNKQVSDTLYNRYVIKSGPGNSADIFYQKQSDLGSMIVSISNTGDTTTQTIHPGDPADTDYYVSDFIRTNDGFAFTGVEYKTQPLLTDGLVFKTDAAGNVSWLKKFNIRLGDNFFNIARVGDGYIVLGASGLTDWGSSTDGDILLLKLDQQGNKIWTRAFGGAKMDYARHLRVLDQHILFAGQSSYPGQSVSIPAVCKTDRNGDILMALPFQPEPASVMKKVETPVSDESLSLVQTAEGPDESLLSAGNIFQKADDGIYPFVVRNDKNGNDLWHIRLSDYPATMKVFKRIRPNEYVAIIEVKDLFTNWYDIYKLDEKGKKTWTGNLRASNIKDVTGTRDGGMLITGAMDISFVNYETFLLKLDASGNKQWEKTIGDLRVWETGRKIIETPEQDFLVAGNVQTEYDLASYLYALKIDKNGNKLWSKKLTDGITTDVAYDVIITPDQGYLFAGSISKQPFTNRDLILVKTDKNGNIAWKKTADLHLMDEGFQVMNSNDGGFLLTGTTAEPQAGALEKFVFVAKTDASGEIKGARYYGKRGLLTTNPYLTVLSSGDTVLSGTTQEEYGKEFLFTVKIQGDMPGRDPAGSFVRLFPNPSPGSSTLWISGPATGAVTIAVYDRTGKKIKDLYHQKTSNSFREEISIPGLPAGVYYVNVWLNGTSNTIAWLVAP